MTHAPLPGRPQHCTEEATIAAIRSVLTEEATPQKAFRPARANHQINPRSAAPVTDTNRAFVDRMSDPALRRRATDFPDLQPAQPEIADTVQAQPSGIWAGPAALISRVRRFRPNTRHLVLVSIALLIALRPHWFVMTAVLTIALVVGTFLLAGPDRIWGLVLARLARVQARDPARAARLRARLDRFACRWDAILDRFPDGSVDGLYMPDLQGMEQADAAHTRAMSERLHRMAQDT